MHQQRIGELARPGHVGFAVAGLQAFQQRIEQEGVVVEIGVQPRLAVLGAGKQAPVAPHIPMQEIDRILGRIDPVGTRHHPPGMRQPGDHQGIPAGELLVVAPGTHARLACGKQLGACVRQPRRGGFAGQAQLGRDPAQRARQNGVPMRVLEIGRSIETVYRRRHGVFLGGQQRADFIGRPHVEPAFMAFAVGIQRRIETALRRAHFAQQPADDALCGVLEQGFAGQCPGVGIQVQQRAVVVEHFFEVRDEPLLVDGVATESAAELIDHAARRHLAQGEQRHLARLRIAASLRLPQQEEQLAGARKLGRAREAAPHRVEGLRKIAHGLPERRIGQRLMPVPIRLLLRERGAHRFVLRQHFAAPLVPGARDVFHQVDEAGQLIARRLGEIGAGEERRLVGRQKHRQRPAAAALGQELMRGLVDLVEIGPLLAVDLDVDEQAVHHRRHLGILEAVVRHHMAPVTGRIADRQQDGLVLAARFLQGFLAPRVPVDRVVGMLQQVGTGFGSKTVGHGGKASQANS